MGKVADRNEVDVEVCAICNSSLGVDERNLIPACGHLVCDFCFGTPEFLAEHLKFCVEAHKRILRFLDD